MTTSPTKTKQKLSLRKRLFVKKSPKVGCVVDTDSNDEFAQSSSRPISPADPFLAASAYSADHSIEAPSQRNCSAEPLCNNLSHATPNTHHEDDSQQKCCRTFFRRSRPKSLVDNHNSKDEACSVTGSPENNSNSISDQTICSQTKSEELPKASVKFPKNEDIKKCFEHSGSFEGIKSTKSKIFVKRLSADHLISNESKPLYRASSPESDRSSSLDRKRR